MHQIIFLTACINPKGMHYTALNNINIRKQQYIKTLRWYLDNIGKPIVFVENSGNDISMNFANEINSGRLEMITFDGNNYDRSLGKGYGEAEIIEYGLNMSRFVRETKDEISIIKITGSRVCRNIKKICERCYNSNTVYVNISKDDWGGNTAVSNFVIAPLPFWRNYFLPNRKKLNDTKGYYFEHLLYDQIISWEKKGNRMREFFIMPNIEGISGTTGLPEATRHSMKQKAIYYYMYFMHRFFNYRGYLNPFYKGNNK